jgi:hypothetical protein
VADADIVRIRLSELSLHRPRQWGACWLASQLWEQLGLDRFWAERLPPSRKGTRWDWVLQILVFYRFIEPGSEWRLYRHWFEHSALADLLGVDLELADIHKLYECHDRLLTHQRELFDHLTGRWRDLFNARFEVLLYDLTSTYFESDPPFPEGDKRRYGYSRDKRSDCVQVVIALIVTPEGFPLAYEVMAGNTSDKTTLGQFLKKLGAALHDFPTAARLMKTAVAPKTAQLSFSLRKDKLRQARKREGRYLLRTNIVSGCPPEELWHFYIQLAQVEGAFKDLKDDLSLRPIHHQLERRIEAHIFISFLAYCLHVTDHESKTAKPNWRCSEDLANDTVDLQVLTQDDPSNPPSRVRPHHPAAAGTGAGIRVSSLASRSSRLRMGSGSWSWRWWLKAG